MTAHVWVLADVVLALHDEQLAAHGSATGVRDPGGLESALARPQNLAAYDEDADTAQLASAYAYGIARSHPFIDGNKRAALVTAELFLALNGYALTASDSECVITMHELASGALPEDSLATWFRDNSEPL